MEWERGATRTRGPAQRQVAAGETDGTARTFGGSTGGGAPPLRKPIVLTVLRPSHGPWSVNDLVTDHI